MCVVLCRTPVVTDAQCQKVRLWPQHLAAQLPCSLLVRLTDNVLQRASATVPISTPLGSGDPISKGSVGTSGSPDTPVLRPHSAVPQQQQQQQLHSTHIAAAVGGEHLMMRAASAVCRALWLRATMLRKHLQPSLPNTDGSFWKIVDNILVRFSPPVGCRFWRVSDACGAGSAVLLPLPELVGRQKTGTNGW